MVLTWSNRLSIPQPCQIAKYVMHAFHLLLKNIHNLKNLVPTPWAFLCHGSFKGSAQIPCISDCSEWTSSTHKSFSVSFSLWKKKKLLTRKRNRMKDPYWQLLPRDAIWDLSELRPETLAISESVWCSRRGNMAKSHSKQWRDNFFKILVLMITFHKKQSQIFLTATKSALFYKSLSKLIAKVSFLGNSIHLIEISVFKPCLSWLRGNMGCF